MQKLLISFSLLLATITLYSQATCSNPDVISQGGTYNAVSGSDYRHWFVYTNNTGTPKTIEISTVDLTTVDTYIAIYSTCNGSSLDFSDDFSGYQAQLTYTVSDGESILINMTEFGQDDSFDYNFSVTFDDGGNICSAAQNIYSSGTYRAVSLGVFYEHWFAYTNETSTTQEIVVSTVGLTSTDTYMELHEDCEGSRLAYNDDFSGLQSQITRDVVAGETVLIRMTEFGINGEFDYNFSFSIDGESTVDTDIDAPVLDEIVFSGLTLSLNESGSVSVSFTDESSVVFPSTLNLENGQGGELTLSLASSTSSEATYTFTIPSGASGTYSFESFVIRDERNNQSTVEADNYSLQVNDLASSVGTFNANTDLSVFPNPATDVVTISSVSDESIEVFDAQGNVYSVQFSDNQLNVSELSSGVYFLRQGNQVVSFIKS